MDYNVGEEEDNTCKQHAENILTLRKRKWNNLSDFNTSETYKLWFIYKIVK